MKKTLTDIICIGAANIDHKFVCHQLLIKGTSNPVSSSKTFGGVARNVAENLSHWTSQIYLQTVLGDDADGMLLKKHMEQLNVNMQQSIVLNNQASSHYYSIQNPNGEMQFAFSDMAIYDDLNQHEFMKKTRLDIQNSIIFIDTNLPRAIIEVVLKQARQAHLRVCIDPVSIEKAKKLDGLLDYVYLLKPNRLEAEALTGIKLNTQKDCLLAGKRLLEQGCQHVVLTMGNAGYLIINNAEATTFDAFSLEKIIDENGAGDAFMAGILLGLQLNLSLKEACKLGAAAAHFTLRSLQTVVSDLSKNDLINFINSNTLEKSHEIYA